MPGPTGCGDPVPEGTRGVWNAHGREVPALGWTIHFCIGMERVITVPFEPNAKIG